jgi:RimJ/RimL family protein N-acetyltransferase
MDVPGVPTLVTERLRLRGIRGSDIEDYAALYADPEVTRYLLGSETWDRGRSWRHMAFAVGHWQLEGSGIWVVEEKASGAFVGVIGFWEPATWPGLELAYHLARRFWGQGYATECGFRRRRPPVPTKATTRRSEATGGGSWLAEVVALGCYPPSC